MSHLSDNNISYFKHMFRTWRWGAILFIHGLFPNVFKTTVSDEMCNHDDMVAQAEFERKLP